MKKFVEVGATKEFANTYLNDIFFRFAVNAVLDAAPAADVAALTRAEKQAIFRLGQMDMREAIVSMLKDAADNTSGITRAALLDAASMVKELEVI